jgi:hypothetical protein
MVGRQSPPFYSINVIFEFQIPSQLGRNGLAHGRARLPGLECRLSLESSSTHSFLKVPGVVTASLLSL